MSISRCFEKLLLGEPVKKNEVRGNNRLSQPLGIPHYLPLSIAVRSDDGQGDRHQELSLSLPLSLSLSLSSSLFISLRKHSVGVTVRDLSEEDHWLESSGLWAGAGVEAASPRGFTLRPILNTLFNIT